MNSVIALEPARNVEISATPDPAVSAEIVKPHKLRVWTAFATFIVAVIAGQIATIAAMIAVGIGVGFVMGAQGVDPATIQTRVQEIFQMPLPLLVLTLVPFQIGMAIVLLLAARRSKVPVRERLGLLPQTGRMVGGFKLATLAAFTLSIAWSSVIVSSLLGNAPAPTTALGSVISDSSWLAVVLVGIVLSVIPAIVEEAMFRGFLQRRFLQRWSPAVSIGITTLLFALIHWDSLQHVVAVVPLGIVTGLLAFRTKSIKPGMLVHALHNAGVVGFGAIVRLLAENLGQEELGFTIMGLIAVMALAGLPAVISLLRSAKLKPAIDVRPTPIREVGVPDAAASSWLAGSAV